MFQRLVGPLAEIPRHICLKSFEKFIFSLLIISSFIFNIGCVETTVSNSYSVKIFADVTILSLFLKSGY